MAQRRRAWKLQEFVAHGGNVTCLAFGHKSGRVMVTGGDDRKVNLWAVGKPHCIMSLTGHTTAVEAVRFGHAEEMVVAGSLSGALKVWNLEEAKIMRTLTGHKSSIRSLDIHPYGGYIASGSMDCNIKLWDIKRKGCIYTYKGHSGCVNSVRFSPDGRWMASAGEDGLVKLWDLTAGKLLTDLNLHKGSVNAVEFHPNELLLASGSADRTVKFWDLETFQLICTTDSDSSAIRCLSFQADGLCLFSGTKDMLKVYGWEPVRCFDAVSLPWGDVSDISIAQNQLIGASFTQTNVSTYVTDLQMVQPIGHSQQSSSSSNSNHLSNSRKNFITERPPTQSTRQASVPKEESEDTSSEKQEESGEDNQSVADIQNPDDYREHFQANSRLAYSPPKRVEPFQPPIDDGPSWEPEPIHHKPSPAPPSNQTDRRTAAPPAQVDRQAAAPPSQSRKQTPPPQQAVNNKQKGIAAEDFLPKSNFPGGDGSSSTETTEPEVLTSVEKGHTAMLTVLSSRSRNLQIVRAMWMSGNTKTAVDSAISMNDPAVMVDILNVLNGKASLWNLDLCTAVIPQLKDLLNSKYETYVMTACNSLRMILKTLGPVIKANMTAPPSIGVDISREERHKKCNSCYITLMAIRSMLEKRQGIQGKLGNTFRELLIMLGTLD